MLKKGFLKTLSDYVSEATIKNLAVEKEAIAFGLMKCVVENDEEKEKFQGLFSEWLVFDRKQKLFDELTGLEYFIKYNPLKLPDEEINTYKELLIFETGYFEVKEVEIGRGMLLGSIATGMKYFVHDINSSFSVKNEDTVWTRIASVGGLYHIVGSSIFIMPIKIMPRMREAISKWDKNLFDAKEIVSWLASSKNKPESIIKEQISAGKNQLAYKEAETNFKEALERCHMDTIFSVETYKKWITDERRFGASFASNALFCLMPTNTEEKDISILLNTAMNFANLIPRKFLKGKTPVEALSENKKERRIFEMDVSSKEKYILNLEKAHELMKNGEYKKGYKTFEGVVKDLLKDRTPFFDAFRIYANSAVCCLADEDLGLGEELLEASLRINSHYDFAIRTKELEIAPYDDFSVVPKKDRKFSKMLQGYIKEEGIRRYKRTVFRKYEDFLKKVGVSLNYETKTTSTIYSVGKDGKKIGRNEPCYCGSSKKFKKCHGG